MIYRFGDCHLDMECRELRRHGELIPTDRQVFAVLCYLIEHCDRLVTRQELLNACWSQIHVSDESLTRCMSRVRKAIGQLSGTPELIQTVYGHGLSLYWQGERPDTSS